MPRSFLLKRFARTVEWSSEEKNDSLTAKGEHEYKNNDANTNGMNYHPGLLKVWDARPVLTNSILTVGMEWSQHNQVNIDKSNNNDFLHHMIYHNIPTDHPVQLNESQSSKQASKTESNNKQTYKCHQCGKVFKTKYTLTIHLKMPSHTGARPFVCAICGKGFRLSSTLCRHKIIHTSHKPHQCQTCGKAFNRSSTLKTHQRTHSDIKEFACNICGKGFHQKGNLRNHLLIHSGEKPYKCTLCKRAFNKLSNLKFHMHVHTDNKPYRCRFCKNSFPRRCELKEHISTCSKIIGDNPSGAETAYSGTSKKN